MRAPAQLLSALVLLAVLPCAWSSGGGSMSMPQMDSPRALSPQDEAKIAYNKGIKYVRKADKFQASAAQLTDPGKKERALRDAQDSYTDALEKFQAAVDADSNMYEAWNYVGYTNRKLGHYEVALTAYERALALHPGYPEALEYRGEAYLGLSRIPDAQQTYLDLFASDRAQADRLLGAMKSWLDSQKNSSGADTTVVSDLDKWVQERAQIASQTASLTREGTAATWN